MRQYVKKIIDSHSYQPDTKRKRQSKYRKVSKDRRGLKSAYRMAISRQLKKAILGC